MAPFPKWICQYSQPTDGDLCIYLFQRKVRDADTWNRVRSDTHSEWQLDVRQTPLQSAAQNPNSLKLINTSIGADQSSVHRHFLTHGEQVLTVQLEMDLASRLSRGLASVLEQNTSKGHTVAKGHYALRLPSPIAPVTCSDLPCHHRQR